MSMEFETSLGHTYTMDRMDHSNGFLIETPMDSYLQYPPSPSFHTSSLLPSSPMTLNLPLGGEYTYSPETYDIRPLSPLETTVVSPPLLGYTLSAAGDASSDEQRSNSGRHSRGSNHTPPPTVPYAATVPRSHRYNPIAVPSHVTAPSATRASVRRARTTRSNTMRSNDESDIEEDDHASSGGVDLKREAVRRQRIESEQKRRDELRDGYTKLREALPTVSQKCSKVLLLDRASQHIKGLNTLKMNLERQLKASEDEVNRLRSVNEALMLGTASQRHAARHGIAPNGGNLHPQQF
ncbi:hypothetical protein E1B28_001620 [Marasmius oreades]|uniref:BHLH domain-containing protein n=1 Tax=Marasmius oreades TaxID=181124 RepID=A0A9P8AFL7_9AGAR|nr:uncharacterized protein E1B28_001620 [Marasmius oreades]KAG7099809.1 hypothetical protein E1B28_001620 [Marasmius oreades]